MPLILRALGLLLILCGAAAAQPCAPATWVSLEGAPRAVPASSVIADMAQRDVVLLGEAHDDPDAHRWQLQVLAALHAARPDMVIGFESFPRAAQPVLDRWVRGELTMAQFLEQTHWREVWNFPPELYEPLFEFARLNRVPMLALNVERRLVHAVSEKGWTAVPPAEREGVSTPAAATPAYRDALLEIYREHRRAAGAEASGSERAFENFVDAQLLWDRAMAEALARGASGGKLAVAIVGSGHVREGHGVPHQLRALGVERIGTLLPLHAPADCAALRSGLADSVFLLPPARAVDAPPRLGVALEAGKGGVRVARVEAGSLAERSGLRAGDVITAVAGREASAPEIVVDAVRHQPAGTWLPLQVRRGETRREIVVRFPPAPAARAHSPDLALEVELDPQTRAFSAVAELARPAGTFRFTLHESLSVRGAQSAPAGEGRREWHIAVPRGGKVRIEYGGTLPALDRRLDHRQVLGALAPMAAPEGSFLPDAGGWYPRPADLFTYRVRLTVKGEGQKALVPGRLLQEEESGAEYSASFEALTPAEGVDLMAGRYDVSERRARLPGGREVRLRTYFFRELAALSKGYLDDAQRYLERYSELIGPYPFAGFSIVASPLPTGFGMPSLTYLGASVLKLPFIRATSLGHEVLHNWWGNGVLVDDAGGNWAEGLTTFMADYAFREDASAESARDMRLRWLRDLAAAPSEAPLAAFRARKHGTEAVTGYDKAAMVFLMLRDAIGADAFARGVRDFWERYRDRRASWDDLRSAFERAAGRSLRPFFDQWLTRSDAPSPEIAQARYADGRLEIDVMQPAPPYALRIPIEIRWRKRAEMRFIDLAAVQAHATFELAVKPDTVQLDPELRLWRRLEPGELPPILRQWILAPAPALAVVSAAPQVRDAAAAVANAFFESAWQGIDPLHAPAGKAWLLAGLESDVDRALARLGLPARPQTVANRGTAQAWTVPGTTVAVLSARDAASLAALQHALPHLGAQSWVVFEGERSVARGAWSPQMRRVPVQSR